MYFVDFCHHILKQVVYLGIILKLETMTPFTPNETITIIGAIALAVIMLYNFCKMIAKKLK